MAQRIQLRRGTAAAWTAANPVLASAEPGVETDTGLYKLGDGTRAWTALPYAASGDGAPPTTDAGALVTGTLAPARLAAGGADGQVLAKVGSNLVWTTPAAGGGSGVDITPDASNPGLYLIGAGSTALTPDPANPGLYLIGA